MTIKEKILELANIPNPNDDIASLINAYIATLDLEEVYTFVIEQVDGPKFLRRKLRGRLKKILSNSSEYVDIKKLSEFILQLKNIKKSRKIIAAKVDVIFSELFEFMPPEEKQIVLNGWLDRGTMGAMHRWIKATKGTLYFDHEIVYSYWKLSGDWRAAQALAYYSNIEFLTKIIPDIVDLCDRGWIISKAILRIGLMGPKLGDTIADRHPATYLYICSRLNISITDEMAFALVFRCQSSMLGGERGLAIWAIGQMKKTAVLEKILVSLDALAAKDY